MRTSPRWRWAGLAFSSDRGAGERWKLLWVWKVVGGSQRTSGKDYSRFRVPYDHL